MRFGVELGLRKNHHHTSILPTPKRRVEYSLVCPSLHNTFTSGHFCWQMNVRNAVVGLEQEVHSHPDFPVKDGQSGMPSGCQPQRTRENMANHTFEIGCWPLLVVSIQKLHRKARCQRDCVSQTIELARGMVHPAAPAFANISGVKLEQIAIGRARHHAISEEGEIPFPLHRRLKINKLGFLYQETQSELRKFSDSRSCGLRTPVPFASPVHLAVGFLKFSPVWHVFSQHALACRPPRTLEDDDNTLCLALRQRFRVVRRLVNAVAALERQLNRRWVLQWQAWKKQTLVLE